MNLVMGEGPPVRKTVGLLGGAAFLSWVKDLPSGISGAACDLDREMAAVRANGEYLEHLSQSHATAPALASNGVRIQPHLLCGSVSESLGAEHWMAGRGIVSGAEYLVPAQAVLLGWDPPAEKRWWVQTSVGTAAHPDPDAASRAALAEVLERDALVRGWRTGEIEFHDLGWLLAEALPASLYNKIVTDNVTISVVRAGSTAFHPVLAMMHRRDGGNLTCGAAIRADTRAAVRHAVLEALLVRVSLSAPAQPGRLEAHHHTRGLLAAQNGPQHLRFIAERSNGPDTAVATETTLPALSVHARERFGHEPVVVDLPAAAGHAVRRVICPGSSVLEPRGAETGLLSPIA